MVSPAIARASFNYCFSTGLEYMHSEMKLTAMYTTDATKNAKSMSPRPEYNGDVPDQASAPKEQCFKFVLFTRAILG